MDCAWNAFFVELPAQCIILHYTATQYKYHCNTIQTLPDDSRFASCTFAAHSNTLQCTTNVDKWGSVLLRCMQHTPTHCSTQQHTAAHNTTLQTTPHCSTQNHIAAQNNTLQHITTHYTAAHNNTPQILPAKVFSRWASCTLSASSCNSHKMSNTHEHTRNFHQWNKKWHNHIVTTTKIYIEIMHQLV